LCGLSNTSLCVDQRHANVNCKAPLNMIRCALPWLEKSGSGRIVNVASLSGKRVANDNVAYSMSKFAVMALTHSARRIAWDAGVRATAVCPSFVRTVSHAIAARRRPRSRSGDHSAMCRSLPGG